MRSIFVGGKNGISILNLKDGSVEAILSSEGGSVLSLSLSQDGVLLAASYHDGSIVLYQSFAPFNNVSVGFVGPEHKSSRRTFYGHFQK